MGREIRMVPPNWEHPKTEKYNHFKGRVEETYVPLHDDRASALAAFAKDIEEMGLADAIDHHGGGPISDDYVDYDGVDPTWFQVYETVSEGTPVTPPFATREELVEYLATHGDFWDQERNGCPWKRKSAENFVFHAGWVPTLVIDNGVVQQGRDI